jgi:hypothetical protein
VDFGCRVRGPPIDQWGKTYALVKAIIVMQAASKGVNLIVGVKFGEFAAPQCRVSLPQGDAAFDMVTQGGVPQLLIPGGSPAAVRVAPAFLFTPR